MTTPKKPEGNQVPQSMTLAARDDRRLAKYCNLVTFAVFEGNVIMSFIAKDVGMLVKENDGTESEQGVLIERIIVDRTHAQRIAEKLNEVISKSQS